MFWWLGLALFVDGIDGPIARKLEVKEILPTWSGELLDNIIDYVTYVLIPAFALYQFGLMGEGLSFLWAAIIVLPEIAIGGQLLFGTFAIVDGSMTVGTLVAGVTIATYLRWPTDSIGWLLAETNQAATASARYWEVRDAEALDLVLALNTGVPSAATIHANSAREALVKLAALPLLAGRNIHADFIVPAIASSLDLVAHCVREPDGRRRIAEVVAPTGHVTDGTVDVRTVYSAQSRHRRSTS